MSVARRRRRLMAWKRYAWRSATLGAVVVFPGMVNAHRSARGRRWQNFRRRNADLFMPD